MKKLGTKSLLAGAAVAAALGAVAGMLLAPESGKKLRQDIKKTAGQLYREAMPQLKKMKNVGKVEFEKFMGVAASKFASAKKLSAAERKQLIKEAKGAWGKIKKHLK
ncbi:MAG: YtxH domain-containing protein [bacterium]|nr:YtxH domain-containing protein [bacterium]